MKTRILLFALLLISTACFSQAKKDIERVEPPNWWVGMKNQKLQLLVYGKNIAGRNPSIAYKGVTLQKVTKVENPNYLFLDLVISEEAQAGTMPIVFTKDKKELIYKYELKKRRQKGNQQGLDAGDVVYLIMPDRFANGDTSNDSHPEMEEKVNRKDPYGRHGGDLKGLTEHLGYIADLGATAIWMTPFQENAMPETSFHGYAMTDMFRVDPRIGTNGDYKNYVQKAHEQGLKVVIDVVFNQIGLHHWWMRDLPMENWINQFDEYTNCNWAGHSMPDIHAAKIDQQINVEGWFNGGMPDMNQANDLMLNYLSQLSIWWIEFANLDAIRFDTYQYNKERPLAEWANRLYKEYPEMYYCAEVWINDVPTQTYWQKHIYDEDIKAGRFPGMIDFPHNASMLKTFQEGWSIEEIYKTLTFDFLYLDANRNLTFMSNHDTDRFFSLVEEDMNRMKMATTFLLTSRGIPQLYYGEEFLMTGLKKNGGDAQVRFDCPGGWPGDKTSVFTRTGLTKRQEEFMDFTKKLLNWRKKNADLMKGRLIHFRPADEVYVYFRLAENKTAMVVINNNKENKQLDLKRFNEILKNHREAVSLDGKTIDLNKELSAKAKSAMVLELK